jgi:hypothetical protein
MHAGRYCPANKLEHDPMINASDECAAILWRVPELAHFPGSGTYATAVPDIACLLGNGGTLGDISSHGSLCHLVSRYR